MTTVTVFNVANERLSQDFEEIFRENYLLVYRTAYSVTGSSHDAEDVLQNVFLWLFRRGMPADLRDTRAYLYRAAVNASLNIVKSRKREIAGHDAEREPSHTDYVATNHTGSIQGLLTDAIAQLQPRSVEMLILRYEHDYSDAEIAKLLGTSRGVVAVTLHRARARLKKLLRAFSGDKK
jgi:RNA polymerase sigma-70 factor (ECF subfamily)